jgi:hypothetical protein
MSLDQKQFPAMPRRIVRRRSLPHFAQNQQMPMCASRVRAFSLAHRLALTTLRSGQVDLDGLARLFSAIGIARLLYETQQGQETAQQALFEVAWHALLRCLVQVRAGQPVAVNEADIVIIDQLLTLHDAQMAVTPEHELLAATRHLARYLSPCLS